MTDDAPRHGQGPKWKAAAPGRKPGGPQYGWKARDAEPAPGQRSRVVKQVLYVFGGIACIALIAFLISILRPRSQAGLVVVGANPANDIENLAAPLDIYGWLGGQQLAAWAEEVLQLHQSRWGKLTPKVLYNGLVSAADFGSWADSLAKRDPLIVFFGLHGGADPKGAFLFTTGGERLYLQDIVTKFAGSGFAGRQVVLIFDPSRLAPNPSLGQLHNDCVRGLRELEPIVQSAESKLVVICGSSPGERSWDSEEWRCSAFARTVLDGLRGVEAPQGRDTIKAWDLFDYVKRQTAQWTGSNRPTAQTPFLMPAPEAGGRERAESIAIAMKVGDAGPADPPGATFTAPADLTTHWTTCGELAKAVPSPAVYTPQLWRRYRELMIRYEHLVRAGEEATAKKLAGVLTEMEKELNRERLLLNPSESESNTLPLSAAYGLGDPTALTGDEESNIDRRWITPPATDAPDPWQEMSKQVGTRLKLTSYLVNKAGKAGADDDTLIKAADSLSEAYKATSLRPAEAHFLLMLRHFFWPKQLPPVALRPKADLLQRAVYVRLLAEQAAVGPSAAAGKPLTFPYTEQVWRVIRPTIEAGDAKRRPGEDRLFSGEVCWPEAKKLLDEAAGLYQEALGNRMRLQEALALRDEVLADLPFLTRWQASQRVDEIRISEVERLWTDVHALDIQLSDLARQPQPDAKRIPDQKLVDDIRQQFDKLMVQFHAAGKIPGDVQTQTNWMALEQVLAVPLLDPNRLAKEGASERIGQIRKSREMSAKFNREGKSSVALTPENAEDHARRQARLAIAVLGHTLLDDQARQKTGVLRDAKAVRDRIVKKSSGWETEFNEVSYQVGAHWRQLVTSLAEKDLATAEGLSRHALTYVPLAGSNPVLEQRRLRWRELLVDLARRSCHDHWYAENGNAYFAEAANRYLKDADQLAPAPSTGGKDPPRTEADDLLAKEVERRRKDAEDLLKAPPIELTAPQQFYWTTDRSWRLDYKVDRRPNLPGDNYVTLWPSIQGGALRASNKEDTARGCVQLADGKRSLALDNGAGVRSAKVEVSLRSYFRGQNRSAATSISFDATPERIVANYPPGKDDVAFAVRADENFRGAVAIVLDYSRSMRQPNEVNGKSKYEQMLEVLPKVLIDLPHGTILSVRAYGHIEPPNLLNNQMDEDTQYRISTNATISELIVPRQEVTWGPTNRRFLDDFMARLKLPQNGGTPLVKSMKEAKADFPANFVGPRTLLVLSDGADTSEGNSTPASGRLNPLVIDRVREKFKQEFANEDGITVQMVVFTANNDEWTVAQKQFQDVTTFKNNPGLIDRARDAKDLGDKLRLALRPKLRLYADGNPVRVVPPPAIGLPAGREGDQYNELRVSAAFAPGQYYARVYGSTQPFVFDRGDRLLVRLRSTGDGVRFGRDLFADMMRGNSRRRKEEGNWVLGVPNSEYQVPNNNRLRLLTTLESKLSQWPGQQGDLKLSNPGYTWWEVSTKTGKSPGQLRVAPSYGYPAASWDVTVDNWPDTSRPDASNVQLSVWRSDRPPTIGPPIQVTLDAPKEVLIDGKRLVVTASVEDKVRLQLMSDEAVSETSCLVVRLRPATTGGAVDDSHVMVQLGDSAGIPKSANEHRYFQSGSYTAAFGPVTREQLEGKDITLELLSITKLKTDSTTKIVLELDPPQRGDGPQFQKLNPSPVVGR